jgi:hypothetical protein
MALLLLGADGEEDTSYYYPKSNLEPYGAIDIVWSSDMTKSQGRRAGQTDV